MLHSEEQGQVSMEFMAYFGVLLLIFVAFGPVIFNQTVKIRRRSVAIEAGRTATLVERELNSAVRFGDGYRRDFTVPEEVSEQEYNMSVKNIEYGKVLTVAWNDGVVNRRLIATELEGELQTGENSIENSGGRILINR